MFWRNSLLQAILGGAEHTLCCQSLTFSIDLLQFRGFR